MNGLLGDIGELTRSLIEQEFDFQASNPGKFNKDRITMIHNLAGYELPKQATTSAMPGSTEGELIEVAYVD